MALPRWLQILASVGPQVLMFTPLAPIAPAVVAAIGEAEALSHADGAAKLAHVQQIVNDAVIAVNTQAGHQELDPAIMNDTAAKAIGTVVGVVNVVHAAHAEDTAEVTKTVTAASPTP